VGGDDGAPAGYGTDLSRHGDQPTAGESTARGRCPGRHRLRCYVGPAAAQETKPESDGESSPEILPAPEASPADPAAVREQSMLTYAEEVLLETFRLPQGQTPRHELHSTDARTNTFLHYIGPGSQEVSTIHSVDPAGTARYWAVQIREANVHNARNHITADAIYGTLAKYYLPFPEPFASAIWKQFRQPSGAPTIERAWDNEDGSIETVGAALWGQNAPDGPGNYLVVRARLFPGSPHHAARTLFTS
jgi:hypothetical protein